MANYGFYSTSTGVITGMLNQPLKNPNQIEALKASGVGVTEIPIGMNGSNGIVDLATGQAVWVESSPPIPDLLHQYVAAKINAGVLDISAFHPVTIAIMNEMLGNANMTPVAVKD